MQGMIQYDDARAKSKTDKISGVPEMQDMAMSSLEARRAEATVQLQWTTPYDVQVGEKASALLDGQSLDNYLFDYRSAPFRTDSVVGKITRGQWEDMLGAALHDAAQKAAKERDGRWMPVAWRMKRANRRRRNKALTASSIEKHEHWQVMSEEDSGNPRPGRKEVLFENDAILVLEVVFCEVDQMPPTDILFRRNGSEGTSIASFARANGARSDNGRDPGTPYQFRSMPKRMREDRIKCVEILNEFAHALNGEVEADAPSPAEKELTEKQLQFAREALDSGMKIGSVADVLGVSWQKLKALLADGEDGN